MRWGIRRRAQKIVKNTPNRIKSEKEHRRASVNKALESIDSKSENPKYGKGSNLLIGSYNDALGYHRRMGRHDAYDNVYRNAEKYQDRFLKAVNEVDRLYQRGTPNEKKLKRLVDIAYDG